MVLYAPALMTRFRPLLQSPLRFCSYVVVVTASFVACGPDKPPADASTQDEKATHDDYDPTQGIEMTAEVGALPEEETVAAFRNSFPAIQDCFIQGSERIEFLGGDISFEVEVDASGQARVFAKQTTIGDRKTESCMLDVLRGAAWPLPVGGHIGTAENGFGFEMTGDVRPPVMWDSSEVSDVLNQNASALNECKSGTHGTFTATVYVDANGSALGAGISPPNQEGEASSDCLVGVLVGATYPSPGSWPAKVTFSL
jgi:hypothetical protein